MSWDWLIQNEGVVKCVWVEVVLDKGRDGITGDEFVWLLQSVCSMASWSQSAAEIQKVEFLFSDTNTKFI